MNQIKQEHLHQLGGAIVVHRTMPASRYDLTNRGGGGWWTKQGPFIYDDVLINHYLLVDSEPETVTIDKTAFQILFEQAAAFHNGDDDELEEEAEAAFAAGRKVLGWGEFAPPIPPPNPIRSPAMLRDQLDAIPKTGYEPAWFSITDGLITIVDHLAEALDTHFQAHEERGA